MLANDNHLVRSSPISSGGHPARSLAGCAVDLSYRDVEELRRARSGRLLRDLQALTARSLRLDGRAPASGAAGLEPMRIERLAYLFARLEHGHALSGNGYALAGAGIAPDARASLPGRECSE